MSEEPQLVAEFAPPRAKVSWPILLFILGLALPPEASVKLGDFRLSGYRVVLIFWLLPCIMKFISGEVKFSKADWMMLLHSLWACAALVKFAGFGDGMKSGGIYVIEAVGSYFLARCYIRSTADFRAVVRLMMIMVVCLIPYTLFEALTNNHFIRETARAIMGGEALTPMDPRMGLYRAYGTFDHPILYGIFGASALGLTCYSLNRTKDWQIRDFFRMGLLFFGVFLSVSSGAIVAALIMFALMGWDYITRSIGRRWLILLGIIISVVMVTSMFSNRSPMKVFLTFAAFDPNTAYNRLRIFDYGSEEVYRNPVFGIGLGEWQRPEWMSSSMDNFWLATTVRYGVPSFAFLVVGLLLLTMQAGRRTFRSYHDDNARKSWLIALAGLGIAACTVHFWNALFALFCFVVGAGAYLALPPAEEPTLEPEGEDYAPTGE